MTKEAEIGDRYNGAKVVKTTTFGAFVELVKGTDGLLHISNVKPGERVDSVDDVLNAGDEIDVTVVEVDRERGRIGLRLSDDPLGRRQIARRSWRRSAPAIGGPRSGGGGDRGGRGGRDRGGAAVAATRRRAPSARLVRSADDPSRWRRADRARWRPPGRHRGGSLGPLGRARALGPHRIA